MSKCPTRGISHGLTVHHIKCPGCTWNICVFCPFHTVKSPSTVQFLVLHKSILRVELNHFFQVLLDIWEALQRCMKVVTGEREALAVGQSLHCGQMFAFGQHACLC